MLKNVCLSAQITRVVVLLPNDDSLAFHGSTNRFIPLFGVRSHKNTKIFNYFLSCLHHSSQKRNIPSNKKNVCLSAQITRVVVPMPNDASLAFHGSTNRFVSLFGVRSHTKTNDVPTIAPSFTLFTTKYKKPTSRAHCLDFLPRH